MDCSALADGQLVAFAHHFCNKEASQFSVYWKATVEFVQLKVEPMLQSYTLTCMLLCTTYDFLWMDISLIISSLLT